VEAAVTIGERFESSHTGRSVLTGALIFILLALFAANMPSSHLQRQLNSLVQPVRDGLGLDQDWSVFAPEPRRQTFDLDAQISYSDGTSQTWTVPTGDPYISEYRTYHWQKWSEYARSDAQPFLWEPLAAWIARTHDSAARHPTEVTLVRRWFDLEPPGSHPSRGPWNEYTYFSLKVSPAVLSGAS
jgi:hypothetical protein